MFKNKKIVFVIIFILSLILLSNSVFGTLIDEFYNSIDTEDMAKSTDLTNVGGKIVGIIQAIGTMISVGMLGVIGIKYMMGSAEQKAEYKKTMFPYVIGSILIFGASNVTQIIYIWVSNL